MMTEMIERLLLESEDGEAVEFIQAAHRAAQRNWHFPEIDPGRSLSITHYTDKVAEEVGEFETASGIEESLLEVLDVLHSAETLVRKVFELFPEVDMEQLVQSIIAKNFARGYYSPDKSK